MHRSFLPLRAAALPSPAALVALSFLAFGCPSQAPPAESGAGAAEPASGEAESSDSASGEASSETPAAGGAAATGEPAAGGGETAGPAEPLGALCNKMCDAVAPKCSETQLEGCKKTCKNYEKVPPVCEPSARTALECARSDRDFLFCANVVPITCAKQFKAMDACVATGQAPVEQTKKAIPDGWERYQASDAGFSAVIPKGVQVTTEGSVRRWVAKSADGASYEVTLRPAPAEQKWNNRSFLRITRDLFGRCADKLRLHSLIEKPGVTSMQYRTVCPDKTEQHGALYVAGSNLFVLALRFPAGGKPEIDPFVYGFQVGK